ncbi:P27 family phage terminase small subunit [Streptomyces sp. ID05-04B]|uniref:P27 family phage terminase small subunit n=1 Tax=Streptomyces sp. ID05-04B TaxID=3028661 RepID=UPI0029C24BD8|nr:P27 family phage terminase small subunit [Streptomyces sp. ID05-04B]
MPAHRKPHLAAVREGTFRQDRQTEGIRFAPTDPVEPDWNDLIPGRSKAAKTMRADAADIWSRTVPALIASAGLTDTQALSAVEYVMTAVQLREVNRQISADGFTVPGARGESKVRHPLLSSVPQLRMALIRLAGELGLTPSAATKIVAPDSSAESDGIWD